MDDHIVRHKDGSIRARGKVKNGQPHGYWQWFRLDGSLLRSGHFDEGRQTGEWITYDRESKPYKITSMDA